MANSVGTIGIDLDLNNSGFKKSLSSIQGQAQQASGKITSGFKKIATAAVAAFSVKKIVDFGSKCVDLAQVQIEAETKLQTVMRQRMAATDKSINSVKELASAQQQLGVVGDEVQLAGAQQLSTFLNSTSALKKLIPAMNDLAVQQNGVNVTSESMTNIGNLMGKVMQGQTSALTRVGITFSEAEEKILKYGSEEERAATLAQVITNNVGKMNSAIAATPAGKMQQVKNSLGDAMETVGRALNNVFTPLLDFINRAVSGLQGLASEFEKFTASLFGDSNAKASGISQSIDSSAESADGLTENTDNAADSINKTAKEAKKLQNQLAGFDELNILSQPDDEAEDITAEPQTQAAAATNAPSAADGEKSGNNFLSGFQKVFKDLYKRCGLDKFFTNIQSGINKVNWGSIGDNCKRIFDDLKPIASSAFKGAEKIGKSSMSTLGKFIGGTVSVAGKGLQTVTGGVSKWLDKDKTKIAKGIDEISTDVSRGIDNVGIFFDSTFSTLGGSIDRMRPTMESAIAQFMGGATDLGLSLGTILSGAFEEASNSLANWAINNEAEIGKFFDNLQIQGADVMNTLGGIMSDIGTTLTSWWTKEGGGREIFANVCDMFTNIGTTFMNIYNDWIMPAWNFIVGLVQSAWDNCLKPIFDQAVSLFGKIADCISTVWNNFLSPIVNWLVDVFGPIFTNVFNAVKGVFDTVFGAIGGVISGIMKTFGGLLDFITGVFSGDWEKAWQGICDFFGGIWDGIWGIIKGVINLIIDGINLLWTGIYTVVSAIVNAIGGIAGAIGSLFGQDWNFSMPSEPPLIPKLASGGLVTAPTLALVGDNRGAGAGNPEVVAPLNRLQGMINSGRENGDSEQVAAILLKIYELLLMFIDGGGNVYEFTAELNGDPIFKEMIRQNNIFKKRHGGHSAFEGV